MYEIGVIKVDDPTRGISLARWQEHASSRPQYVQGPAAEAIDNRHFHCADRWAIVDGNSCIGSLTWNRDSRPPGDIGYLVVASAQPDSHAAAKVAESLANELAATYHPCSAKYTLCEALVLEPSVETVEIHFHDGETVLAALSHCQLWKHTERVYYYNLDRSAPSYGEGLCGVDIDKISSIVASDVPRDRGDSRE